MQTAELDYPLPDRAIATQPVVPRDASRLMVLGSTVEHQHFRDIIKYLRGGDLLVVNKTRVIPAKLALHKPSGAAIFGLFLRETSRGTWEVMLRTRGKVKIGDTLLAPPYSIQIMTRLGEGRWQVAIIPSETATVALEKIGHIPLPPYISRRRKAQGLREETPADGDWYQTVYAQTALELADASVAAPTAGLHFTPELLAQLGVMGVEVAPVELAVGMGTFLPVEAPTLENHAMHAESYHVSAESAARIRAAHAEGRRVVAVGTTAVRTLESAAAKILDGPMPVKEITDQTRLLIAPGFGFQLTDALITNFHLPRSTLLALVGAFLGTDGVARLKAHYAEAIAAGYRFYSYGDAMFIPQRGAG